MPKLNGKQEGGKERLTFETMEEAREYYTRLVTLEVPFCNSCRKPHFGRKRMEDRCICDMSGNYSIRQLISEEIPLFDQWLSEEKVTILSELKQ